jgi:paraquat-inducible protein B
VSRRASPTLIGAFVLGGLAIGVAAVLLLASGSLFESRDRFVLYFDEPVTGLSVGAPVVFEGVDIGNVVDIRVVIDYEHEDKLEIPVTVVIAGERVQVRGQPRGTIRGVRAQIDRGLRARLATQSLLTGQLYVSLDYFPDKPALFKKPLDSEPPEIVTIPSELTEVRKTFRGLADRLGSLPLEDLVSRIASAAQSMDALLRKPQLDHAIAELDASLTEAHSALTRLDGRIDPLADETQATVGAAREALTRLQGTVANADQMVQPGSPVQVQLLAALQEVERAARAVQTLADALAAKPDAIVFGKGSDTQ